MSFHFCIRQKKGRYPIYMQMSGGHLLAARLDGGNARISTKGENRIRFRLAENICLVKVLIFL